MIAGMRWHRAALVLLLVMPACGQSGLERLRAQAEALAQQEQPDATAAAAAVARARSLLADASTDAGALLGIAVDLGNAALGTEGEDAAYQLLRDVRRRAPAAAMSAFGFRVLADLAWSRGDLRTVADAVRDGVRAAAADPFERTLLWVDEIQLQCALGRLEAAGRAGEMASASIEELRRSSVDTTAVESAVGFALADLHLLTGRPAAAKQALKMVSVDSARRRFFLDVLRVLAPECSREDEAIVERWSRDAQLDATLRTFAAAKVVQAALRRDDVAAARSRLSVLETLCPAATGAAEGRTALYEGEIALRTGEGLAAARADLETAFERLLTKRREAPPMAGGIGILQVDDRASLVSTLLRTDAALGGGEGVWRALDRVIASHAASLTSAPAAGDARTLVRSLLGEQHGLLVFVTGVFASVVFAVDRDRAELFLLPAVTVIRPEAEALVAAADEALGSGAGVAGGELPDTAAKVAAHLLPPEVQARIARWRRLSVSGASLLGNVPWELLPLRDGRRLGEVLPIDHVANLPGDAARAPARDGRRLLFAGALERRASDASAFRLEPRLVDGCTSPYAEHRPSVRLDGEVRRDALLAAMRSASIAHFVGHGQVDWTRAYEHGICFREADEQGQLWGDHVVGADLRGLVVLLSSCHAGVAPTRRGEDPLAASLAGAMLTAGARCVLVPTTTIQVGRHLEAMAVVHARLAQGEPLAVALFHARRAASGDPGALLELLLLQVHGRGF